MQVFGMAPMSKHSELEFSPNSAFPFFDRKKITMPALVLFIISMLNLASQFFKIQDGGSTGQNVTK